MAPGGQKHRRPKDIVFYTGQKRCSAQSCVISLLFGVRMDVLSAYERKPEQFTHGLLLQCFYVIHRLRGRRG